MSIRIYIDQGHNPRDYNTGAEGNGFFEQDVTYEVGIRLNALLERNAAFTPRLSRPTADTVLGTSNSTSLRVRVERANAWPSDLFLSIHANASVNASVSGSECLTYGPTSTVANGVSTRILYEMATITGLENRGIFYRPGLYVLRRTTMPALIVEMGFITNERDALLMAYSPGLFATSIYRGLLSYYGVSG